MEILKRLPLLLAFLALATTAAAEGQTTAIHAAATDSMALWEARPEAIALDTVQTEAAANTVQKRHGKHLRNKFLDGLYSFVKEFSRIDTSYVEPQHYNFQLMLQNTYSFDLYSLRNRNAHELEVKQQEEVKMGPYFGWRWIFLGYMVGLKGSIGEGKQDLGVSLYSNQIGVDLFYRKSGHTYQINNVDFADGKDYSRLEGVPFGGIESSIQGFNLYYIFNHRKFSYPAAYSMSTMQKRSTGSPIAGIGYTKHTLDVDWRSYDRLLSEHLGVDYYNGMVDSTLTTTNVSYTDYALSGGYAYNWVIVPRLLLDISLQGALAYKRSTARSDRGRGNSRIFDFQNVNIDAILRMGMVYNNNRWFAGWNAIMHAYNYRQKQFDTSTVFGNVNVYVGFNFGKR